MNNDKINLIKDSASTFWNIAQMAQYRVKYVQERSPKDRDKMYQHAFWVGVGILSLLTMGIMGLVENQKNDNLVYGRTAYLV